METTNPPTNTPATTTTSPPVVTTPNVPDLSQNNKEIDYGYDQKALQSELDIMITYALQQGKPLPESIVKATGLATPAEQITAFNDMITAIAPATAGSIEYINTEILDMDHKKPWYKVPLFSRGIFISSIALAILIAVSLLPEVNAANQSNGLLGSSGTTLLVNLIFVCSASLLGVMFFLLKSISEKIKNYTLLPVDSVELNATVLIGLISGFIIAELFTFNTTDFAGGTIEIQKMTLALLGGFSSDAIFSILKGVVNKAKAVFGQN